MTKSVVVDSDAIFALYNPNDSLHYKAIETLVWLNSRHFQIVYPTSVIFEVMSLFQRVLPSLSVTTMISGLILNDQITIYPVDTEILKESVRLFNPAGSKKNTLIDCSVAIIAKKIKAIGVFSFDGFYSKQGLKLARELEL